MVKAGKENLKLDSCEGTIVELTGFSGLITTEKIILWSYLFSNILQFSDFNCFENIFKNSPEIERLMIIYVP